MSMFLMLTFTYSYRLESSNCALFGSKIGHHYSFNTNTFQPKSGQLLTT